jgi:hypothetical protein
MLLRYSNRGPMELPDLFCIDLPKEGHHPGTTKALVVVMNHGKTNQHGRMEYGASLRHREPQSCLVSAIAFWFFFRWQVERHEPFPCFFSNRDWYDIKLLRRSVTELKASLSYQTANSWTKRFYAESGIKTSKTTHAPRVAGSQNADAASVEEGQVCFVIYMLLQVSKGHISTNVYYRSARLVDGIITR